MLKYHVFVLLLSIACCETHFQVHLKLPRYVPRGKNATLECEYNVPFNHIHKVEWLKGDRKVFRYVKGRNPPFYNYAIPGGKINWSRTNESHLTLNNLGFEESGMYSCSVTTDIPIYTKMSEEKYLLIVELQKQNPKITLNKKKYVVGDWLEVNCTSGMARPVPELTWLVNGNEVEEYSIKSFPEQNLYSSTLQISFQIKAEHNSGFILTCLSTIPGFMGNHVHYTQYVDHRNDSIKVDILTTGVYLNVSKRHICNKIFVILLFVKIISFARYN